MSKAINYDFTAAREAVGRRFTLMRNKVDRSTGERSRLNATQTFGTAEAARLFSPYDLVCRAPLRSSYEVPAELMRQDV